MTSDEMTRSDYKKVAVFSKPHPDAREVLGHIAACLQRHGVDMLADPTTARVLDREASILREKAVDRADLVISVGGDGTLLATSRAVGSRSLPILGVNLGSLGFLTETRCGEVEDVLDAVLEGRAPIEKRWPLTVRKNGAPARSHHVAMNDVVFSKRNLARLFVLSVLLDEEWVTDFRADGLIIASPTGSTAYSLAAGGPLVLPGVDALVVTPICPHSLSQRPLLFPGNAKITVRLAKGQRTKNVQVTLDGQVGFPFAPEERVVIARCETPVRLVRPPGRSYFRVLRDKLGWGQH